MKKIIAIIIVYTIFIPILVLIDNSYDTIIAKHNLNPLIKEIDMPKISSSEEIVSSNTFDHVTHKIEGKECICNGNDCFQEKHECLEWVKLYYEGKLKSGTFYELFPIPQSKYYQQKIKYQFSFLENGKILRIHRPKGYQYFDKNGNMYEVCELKESRDRGGYYRKCLKKDKAGKWIYKRGYPFD